MEAWKYAYLPFYRPWQEEGSFVVEAMVMGFEPLGYVDNVMQYKITATIHNNNPLPNILSDYYTNDANTQMFQTEQEAIDYLVNVKNEKEHNIDIVK